MALCVIEAGLLLIEVLHCGIGIFYVFYSRDLDLDLMTFIYELDLYSLEMYQIAKMNFLCQGFQKLLSD